MKEIYYKLIKLISSIALDGKKLYLKLKYMKGLG